MSSGKTMLQGALRFTVVSLIGYAMWAFTRMGEAPLYASITVVFIALSGWLLRPLVGPDRRLGSFYGVFATAFLAYAALWCVGWFVIKGHAGEIFGSAAGLAACAWILLRAAGKSSQTKSFLPCWAVLFLCHTLGYVAGGWVYYNASSIDSIPPALARLSWGLGHGIGFGAGLGYVLYHCRNSSDRADG